MSAIIIPTQNKTGSNVQYTLGKGDFFILDKNLRVVSSDRTAIKASGGSETIQIDGQVHAWSRGIEVKVTNSNIYSSHTINIGSTGSIYGKGVGIYSRESNTVINNSGTIESAGTGVAFGEDTTYNYLHNTGSITARSNAVSFSLDDLNTNKLVNYGTITSLEKNGVKVVPDGTGSEYFVGFSLENHGTISGKTGALSLSSGDGMSVLNTGSIFGQVTTGLGADDIVNEGKIIGKLKTLSGDDVVENGGRIVGKIELSAGNDTYYGADGVVTRWVMGEAGNDTLKGGERADQLAGGSGDDILVGRGGNDTLTGDTGVDTLRGGNGDDDMSGGSGNDTLKAGSGDDTLEGDDGNDVLVGGRGDDVLDGGAQDDTLTGGTGDDVLTGGKGDDTFVFGMRSGVDRITDFSNGDQIDLSAFGLVDYIGTVDLATTISVLGIATIDLDQLGGEGKLTIEGPAVSALYAWHFIV